MTSVHPFSYLTAQPAPPKPAFQRSSDLDDEASVSGGFRSGDLDARDDGGRLSQSSLALPCQMDYQRPQVTLNRAQTETSYDLRQHHQKEAAYIENRIKRPPDVAPKHTRVPDNWETVTEEEDYGATHGSALFYGQSNPMALDRLPEKTEQVRDPYVGNPEDLYGQPNRHRGSGTQDARKATPQSALPNDVPFSYTQPIGLSGGAVTYSEMESRNGGVGPNHYYSQSEQGNRGKEPSAAVSAMGNQTIFENFILVGPEKPQTSREAVVPREQPVKRLKLQELFDPPPTLQASPPVIVQDPRKLSIFGVTNTESSDFHSTANSKPRDSGDRTKTKTPVSTFDNPDYNLQNMAYTRSEGSVQGQSDERPWSSAVGANKAYHKAGKKSAPASSASGASLTQGRSTRGRCQSNKLCVTVLLTAIITSIICLGAGFIAGWFGRGRAQGN